MEGFVLSFLKAQWKVSDSGSVHWASNFLVLFQFMNLVWLWSINVQTSVCFLLFDMKVMLKKENLLYEVKTNRRTVFITIRLRSIVLYFPIWSLCILTLVNAFFIIHCNITFLELMGKHRLGTCFSEEIANNTDIDSLKEGADKNMDESDIKENYVSGSPFNSRMKWKTF